MLKPRRGAGNSSFFSLPRVSIYNRISISPLLFHFDLETRLDDVWSEHELIWRDTSRMDWISNYVRGEHMFQEEREHHSIPRLPPVLTAARSTQTRSHLLMSELYFWSSFKTSTSD